MIITGNIPTMETDPNQIIKMIGYNETGCSSRRTESLVDEYMKQSHDLIDTSYSYVIRDVKRVQDNRAFIEDGIIFESEKIAKLLLLCEKVVVFSLTIGKDLENLAGSLAKDGFVLKSTVLDAIGSASVEQLADHVQSIISQIALTDYGLVDSRRFSPGYCDWPVQQQEMVFRTLGDETGGVRLTDGYMMVPQKSISGIIGLGPYGIAEKYNPCPTCEKNKKCQWRR